MKKVIIMGASSGIGLHCAEALASRGVKVGVAARHTAPLEALKERYPDFVEYMSIDVTKTDAVRRLEDLISLTGGMDIYFHVSGIGYENPELDPEMETAIFETNTVGFVRCISGAWRWMRRNGVRGQIAAVTSVAVEQLSRNTGAGIRFTDILPGWTDTPLLRPGDRYPLEMTLDYAVPRIIEAIVRKRRVAVIDWRWNIVVGLWRMIPDCLYVRMNLPVSLPKH